MVNYGFFGDIDVAVIEASALAPDGRVWLTSGIGNAPTWLLRAKKVIIELNHYHDPRVAELADIVIPGAPPRRDSVSIFHAMGSRRYPLCANQSEKDCRRRGNQLARRR
ncbi:hypothetical protein ACLK2C_15600 [Escherichia coli]